MFYARQLHLKTFKICSLCIFLLLAEQETLTTSEKGMYINCTTFSRCLMLFKCP